MCAADARRHDGDDARFAEDFSADADTAGFADDLLHAIDSGGGPPSPEDAASRRQPACHWIGGIAGERGSAAAPGPSPPMRAGVAPDAGDSILRPAAARASILRRPGRRGRGSAQT